MASLQTKLQHPFMNLNGIRDVAITCDVDWAPDFAVEVLAETVESYGFKLTCFATHDSEFLKKNARHSSLEVGIHPDFTKVNVTGSYAEKIARLKEVYTGAVGSRSHRNIFGQNIALELARLGFVYDCSTVAWQMPNASSFRDQYGLNRFMYTWEDGLHLDFALPLELEAVDFQSAGIKIFNFHPALFYLNSPNDDHRRRVVREYSDLTTAPKKAFDQNRNTSVPGIQDFSCRLLKHLRLLKVSSHFMKEMSEVQP